MVNTSASPLAGRLVFVVGAPRSGTQWLQRILAAHPDVFALPSETHLFSYGLSILRDQTQGGNISSPATGTSFMPREDFHASARRFCDDVFSASVRRLAPHAARVVERSPTHVWHLGLIGAVYPDAHVLHIVRDGRDVVRSWTSQSYGPASIHDGARMWVSAINAARRAAPDLAHYREVGYEQLLMDPRRIVELYDWLGLDTTTTSVSAALAEASIAVNVDPTRPDVAAGKWRDSWSTQDLAVFDEAAGDTLAELGYPRDATVGTSRRREATDGRAAAQRPGRLRRFGRWRQRGTSVAGTTGSAGSATPYEDMQRYVDDVLLQLAAGQTDWLTAQLDNGPTTTVKVTAGERRWQDASALAGDRLAEELRADGPWGTVVSADQHITGTTWSVVCTHERAEDGRTDRTVVIDLAPGPAVRSLMFHRGPSVT